MTKHLFVAVTCLCAILLTGGWQGKTQTTNSGKAVLEAYVSAWNRHDFAALDKLATRFTRTSRGRPATRALPRSRSLCVR